jgi:predicted site-specific integrase-resolvase
MDLIPRLLIPGEVAAIFGVYPKTVNRWGRAGKLTVVKTLGERDVRYIESEVEELLRSRTSERATK